MLGISRHGVKLDSCMMVLYFPDLQGKKIKKKGFVSKGLYHDLLCVYTVLIFVVYVLQVSCLSASIRSVVDYLCQYLVVLGIHMCQKTPSLPLTLFQ